MTAAAARPVVDVGAEEAASALGRLLRVAVTAEPAVFADAAAIAAAHAAHVVVVGADTSGGLVGTFGLVIDDAVGAWLAARLTGLDGAAHTPVALAALAELGNIAVSAFLNGGARVVGKTCLPSVPRVVRVPSAQLVAQLPTGKLSVATLRAQQHRLTLLYS